MNIMNGREPDDIDKAWAELPEGKRLRQLGISLQEAIKLTVNHFRANIEAIKDEYAEEAAGEEW